VRIFRFSVAGPAAPGSASGRPAPNVVIEWADIVQRAIHGPASPRSADTAEILHTMAHLAVYDAVVAIAGGSRPFAARIAAQPGADVRAAVATAAYLTARPRLAAASVEAFDQAYARCCAGLASAPGIVEGVRVGQQAAAAMLALRANDGFTSAAQPAAATIGGITPFTLARADVFRPDGPHPSESRAYARDFVETRDFGGAASTVRSAEQTDVAWFWAENPYLHWNRNLIALAHGTALDVRRTARLFAMTHVAASDAIIAGFEAKDHYRSCRPATAIVRAGVDGNPNTAGDPAWRPLIAAPHPEYPSRHCCWSTAVAASVAAFYGSVRVEWTLTTSKASVPALEKGRRSYANLIQLLAEVGNACVWSGRNWRHALRDGALIGGRVASHVQWHHFQPTR